MLSWASASSSSTCSDTTRQQPAQQQQQQQQVAAMPCTTCPATTDGMYNASLSITHADVAVDGADVGAGACCNDPSEEQHHQQQQQQQHQHHQQQQQHHQHQQQQQQHQQQQHHQHHQQQEQGAFITESSFTASAQLVVTTLPARKGRKLRRRRKKSTGSADDLNHNHDDDPPTVSIESFSTDRENDGSVISSVTSTVKEGETEPPPTLTRACRRAMQHQHLNPNGAVHVTTPARSTRSIINMSNRANPTNSAYATASDPNPSTSKSSSSSNSHSKGQKHKGSSESAILKELYVAIRCEFVAKGVRRVVLVSWDHQPLWEACLNKNDNANDKSSGARGKWTIIEYSNNRNYSSKNNNKNSSKNNTTPSPNLCIWRHQSFQQVRFQLQQQITSRVVIGHGLSKILTAWQLPRHPACNVRDASTFSAYMQERVDPLSVMVVPRSLEHDLMPHYLNMHTTATTTTPVQEDPDALLEQAVACMMLYQRSRVEWEQDVSRWMQQQERQRAIRNERLASLSMSNHDQPMDSMNMTTGMLQHQPPVNRAMCCESYPTDIDLSAAADCWSTAGSNYAEEMEVYAATVPPPPPARTKLTRTMTDDDDDDGDYDYDGALVAAVESFSTATIKTTQDAAVAAAATAASEWNGWSTPFMSSATTATPAQARTTNSTIATTTIKATKDRATWGGMLARPVSSEDFLEKSAAAPCLNYPLILLKEEDEEYESDFGGDAGAGASNDDDNDVDTGGHLPSRLLNDSSDEEEDHVAAIPWREKRESSHPIDGDDWLDQDNQDQQHQQHQQPKAVPQAYWFRRRRSVSPPCVRTDIGDCSKYDSNSNIQKSLNQSERHNSRFPRTPSSKPVSCSERGGRRSFFAPPGSEIRKSPPPAHVLATTTEGGNLRPESETDLDQSERQNSRVARRSFFSPLALETRKSPPHIASAMTEGGNLRPRSETETTTTLMDEQSTF